MLGEIFDIVGEHGQVELRSGRAHEHRREYVTGTYFKGKLASERMITDVRTSRGELVDAAILISDLAIEDPAELAPLLELIRNTGIPSLMVVARELAAGAMAPLLAASRWPHPCWVIVVTFQDTLSGQAAMLDDLAALTGARPFLSVARDTLRKVRPEDLGVARRVWADKGYFGLVGGKGSPRAVREHVARLRSAIENSEDLEVRKTLRERLGRLMGGTAVLWVGGISDTDIKARKELAERTVEAVRATIGKGVLPGGGVALLACRPALQRLAEQSDDSDTRAAYQILIRALEEPTRTILRNAGYDAGPWMDRIDRAGAGYGLDVRSGEIVEMAAAGIIDSAGVLIAAVHEAVASAALALTVDVLVHKKRPKTSLTT
jgi:chaperonin GroEL